MYLAKLLTAVTLDTVLFVDTRYPVPYHYRFARTGTGALATAHAFIFDNNGTGRKKIGKSLKDTLLGGIGKNEIGDPNLVHRCTDAPITR